MNFNSKIQSVLSKAWAITIGLCTLWSCSDFVDIALPENEIQTAAVFESDNTALSAVSGLYHDISTGNLQPLTGGMTVFGGLSADELLVSGANTSLVPFYDNRIPANNTTVSTSIWNPSYATIYHINAVEEGLNLSSKVSEEVKKQLLGEVLTLKSLYYFYLTNLFGPIPLSTGTDYKQNASLSRSPADSVFATIITNLQQAKELLNPVYPTAGRVRINQYVVSALLARVYLYRADWENCIAECNNIMQADLYELEDDLDRVFLADSHEAIWQLETVGTTRNAPEGNLFIPLNAQAVPPYALTEALYSAFDDSDKRKTSWIAVNEIDGTRYPYPFKFKQRRSTTPIMEYNMVFRLAEIYLIKAEALLHLDRTEESLFDLNEIRQRAGLKKLKFAEVNNTGALALAIATERRRELFCEWGHRWLDLKRTGLADATLSVLKPEWSKEAVWYPIPQSEIDQNPNLQQNPSY